MLTPPHIGRHDVNVIPISGIDALGNECRCTPFKVEIYRCIQANTGKWIHSLDPHTFRHVDTDQKYIRRRSSRKQHLHSQYRFSDIPSTAILTVPQIQRTQHIKPQILWAEDLARESLCCFLEGFGKFEVVPLMYHNYDEEMMTIVSKLCIHENRWSRSIRKAQTLANPPI